MAFLFLSSAQNPGQYTQSRPDSEYLHKNVDSGGSLNRTCLRTQLLSSIVAANYRGVRQTGIREIPQQTQGGGRGGASVGQWPRCWAATRKRAAPWKAVNSFRVASLSPCSPGPAWHSPLCSPRSHLQSGGCAVGKKEAITQMSATQRGAGDRRGLRKEGGKGGEM